VGSFEPNKHTGSVTEDNEIVGKVLVNFHGSYFTVWEGKFSPQNSNS